jgi:cytochrome c553
VAAADFAELPRGEVVFRDQVNINSLCGEIIVKKFFKWLGFAAIALVGVALIAVSWVFYASHDALNQQFQVSAAAKLSIPADTAEVAEGKRLAQLAGCQHCHADTFGGQFLHDFPKVARFVAPNVSGVMQQYDDAQLEAVIRQGVKADGRGVLFMPSEMFRHLRDEDVARIIAFLRTVPAADGTREKTEVRFIGRFLLAKGDFKPAPANIATLPAPVNTFDAADPVSHGRYLVMNLCTECHAQDLGGIPMAKSPPLAVAKSYDAGQFARLMREGVGTDDRTFELMTRTSKARFVHLRDAEVSAMFAFLQSR